MVNLKKASSARTLLAEVRANPNTIPVKDIIV